MKRVTAILCAIVIAVSMFTGCGGGNGSSGLTSEENDFVKAAIAIGCNDTYSNMSGISMSNKEALKKYSEDLSPLVDKYINFNWHPLLGEVSDFVEVKRRSPDRQQFQWLAEAGASVGLSKQAIAC